jgi:hypothetical protein
LRENAFNLHFQIGQLYEAAAAYEIQLVGAGFVYTQEGDQLVSFILKEKK